jgi:hypothetical protein
MRDIIISKSKESVKAQVCNICGKPFDIFDKENGFVVRTRVGYGSIHDGDELNFGLCCECMDKLIAKCKVSPIMETL